MKTRVLVVDDEPRLSRLVKDILEKTERFTVCEENRPCHALGTARRFQPEIMLLDIHMPGKDGGDLASEFRAEAEFSHTPIIFLSALVSRRDSGAGALERNGMLFLPKPASASTLIPALEQALAQSRRDAPAAA